MSAIPPAPIVPGMVVGSVLQSEAAARRQAAEQSVDEARAATASRELLAADKAVEVEIEATDADTRVHTDAGGQGSYGRHDEGHAGHEQHPAKSTSDDHASHPALDLRV